MVGGGGSSRAAGRHEPTYGQGDAEEAKPGREGRRMEHQACNAAGTGSLPQHHRFGFFRISEIQSVWECYRTVEDLMKKRVKTMYEEYDADIF